MALDFPNSPTLGQVFTSGTKKWTWDGSFWNASNVTPTTIISDTPPTGVSDGQLWFDSSSGVTNVRYDNTWIDVGGGDSGTSAGSVNGIVQCDGNGNFSAANLASDFTGTNQSLTTSGYQKLPGGLIIQWGIVSINYNQTINGPFNYPISFTSSPYTFVASPSSNNVAIDGAIVPYSTSFNSNNFSIYGDYTMSTYTRQTHWLAIGY